MNDPTTLLQSDSGAPRTIVPRAAAERFAPGALVAKRYRIVALLGRGGMGEVYRADDIRLEQQVALKFLPPRLESNSEALERFFAEIRLGRQVSHPNVCRLYDIGEHDGHQFIAMEYVDGEDLSSLLTRIGKLPEQKAIDIARDIAAGLAAAHAAGIVHRDLKPSNVMIDGRGRARITDFGLAMLDAESEGEQRIIGTPAYMAPEQFTGANATPRSDVYAFGLILYECLTGAPLHAGPSSDDIIRRRMRDTSSGSLTKVPAETDPVVDRVLRRCLDPDPMQRPASAQVVLASLPGGDPLAAAMAAGETPSPELVAAAEGRGELAVRAGWTLLGILLAAAVVVAILAGRTLLATRIHDVRSPEALADRAAEVSAAFAPLEAGDTRWWVRWDFQQYSWLQRHRDVAVTARPTPYRFVYRRSPEPLASYQPEILHPDDPPMTLAGMSRVTLDHRGRLLELVAVPPPRKSNVRSTPSWDPLFAFAELPLAQLTPAAPELTPPTAFDEQRAWTGTMPGSALPIRVEAAAYDGRPVWFVIAPPWQSKEVAQTLTMFGEMINVGTRGAMLLLCAFLAFLNLRRGRGDRRGAFRLAVFMFSTYFAARLFRAHHVMGMKESQLLVDLAGDGLVLAAIIALGYLGFEPYVRRYRPEAMISWVRLLHGRVRDALVGRDVLIGLAGGACVVATWHALLAAHPLLGFGEAIAMTTPSTLLGGVNHFVYYVLWNFTFSARDAVTVAMLLAVINTLAKKRWLADALLFLCVFGVALRIPGDAVPIKLLFTATVAGIILVVLRHAGVLGVAMVAFTGNLYTIMPMTLNPNAHFFALGIIALLIPLTLAVLAFVVALAGRPAFGEVP